MTYRILQGDVTERLREMPDAHFHCCVTSPPYFDLRDYGVAGQLGLEPTPEAFVERMVGVFREVQRVLREDGSLWLNIGDSYNGSGGIGGAGKQHTNAGSASRPDNRAGWDGLKPKDLVGIPWRLVLALQADGWYWRSCIAWTKRSAMPESVRDRPTSSWEPIFLLTKAATYFYDAEAVRHPHQMNPQRRPTGRPKDLTPRPGQPKQSWSTAARDEVGYDGNPTGANLRNVWPIEEEYVEWNLGPEPFPGVHFATFPTEVPRRAILAGTSAKGCCPECGAPWEREVERDGGPPKGNHRDRKDYATSRYNDEAHPSGVLTGGALSSVYKKYGYPKITTIGWRPTCTHNLAPVPCRVLDPFLGSGTTCLVAEQLGRDSTGIELSADYCALGERRIQAGMPLTQRKPGTAEGLPLFESKGR